MLENSIIVRAMTLGYVNARVKAMKQTLLSQKETDPMAEAKNVEEIYAMLERTSYRQDLVASVLKEKTTADRIELAAAKKSLEAGAESVNEARANLLPQLNAATSICSMAIPQSSRLETPNSGPPVLT